MAQIPSLIAEDYTKEHSKYKKTRRLSRLMVFLLVAFTSLPFNYDGSNAEILTFFSYPTFLVVVVYIIEGEFFSCLRFYQGYSHISGDDLKDFISIIERSPELKELQESIKKQSRNPFLVELKNIRNYEKSLLAEANLNDSQKLWDHS